MRHNNSNVVIYAGFPKTASQWLLHSLWRADGSGFSVIADCKTVAHDFIFNNPFDFDANQVSNRYEKHVIDSKQRSTVPVIHHEGLSATLYSASPPNPKPLDQLAATFPNSRVILVVREQRRLLLSWYRHNVRRGLGVSLNEYLTETSPGIAPYLRYDVFEFDKIVCYLHRLWGLDNVLVLPYELCKSDQEEYLDRIYTFVGVERNGFRPKSAGINVGLGALETSLIAHLNRWSTFDSPLPRSASRLRYYVTSMARALCRRMPKAFNRAVEGKLMRMIEVHVAGRYQESNRKLQAQMGVDLGQYGYEV